MCYQTPFWGDRLLCGDESLTSRTLCVFCKRLPTAARPLMALLHQPWARPDSSIIIPWLPGMLLYPFSHWAKPFWVELSSTGLVWFQVGFTSLQGRPEPAATRQRPLLPSCYPSVQLDQWCDGEGRAMRPRLFLSVIAFCVQYPVVWHKWLG